MENNNFNENKSETIEQPVNITAKDEEIKNSKSNILILSLIVIIMMLLIVIVVLCNNVEKNNNGENNSKLEEKVEKDNDELQVEKNVEHTNIYEKYKKNINNNITKFLNDYSHIVYDSYSLELSYRLEIDSNFNLKLDNEIIDTNVLQMFVVPTGQAGFKKLYYIKDDGSLYSAEHEMYLYDNKEDKMIMGKEDYSNIVNVFSEVISDDGLTGTHIAAFVDINGNIFSNSKPINSAICDEYKDYLKKLKNSIKNNGSIIYDTYSIPNEYVISLHNNHELKIDNKVIDTNVISMFNIHVGNGGYKKLYYIKDDGSLYSIDYDDYLIEGKDKLNIEKLDYKNIISVVEGTTSNASIPLFIDINGNIKK